MPNVSYQRKTEELLWKKGFYDVIQQCRQTKKVMEHMDMQSHVKYNEKVAV